MMKIGTDPEFVMTNKYGDVENASDHTFFNSREEYSKIGCDGSGTPVEIRTDPVPINRVGLMLDDINSSFDSIGKYCGDNGYKLYGGAYKKSRPIGGHIHFGSKDLIHDPRFQSSTRSTNQVKLVHFLDTLFTPIANSFITHEELEKRIEKSRRQYGQLSEFRKQNWGIEYRTPYSFLLSPPITAGLFSLACLIGAHYKKMKKNIPLYNNVRRFYKLLGTIDGEVKLREIYKTAKPRILKMMSWYSPNPEFNSSILNMFSLIERRKKPSTDILANYKNILNTPNLYIHYINKMGYISKLKKIIDKYMRNTNKGELTIYGVSANRGSLKTIYLSPELPPMKKVPSKVKIIRQRQLKGKMPSIGVNSIFAERFKDPKYSKFIINYLNNLKLDEYV